MLLKEESRVRKLVPCHFLLFWTTSDISIKITNIYHRKCSCYTPPSSMTHTIVKLRQWFKAWRTYYIHVNYATKPCHCANSYLGCGINTRIFVHVIVLDNVISYDFLSWLIYTYVLACHLKSTTNVFQLQVCSQIHKGYHIPLKWYLWAKAFSMPLLYVNT